MNIASRRELFVDDYLIETMKGTQLRLHQPVPMEIAIPFDLPWEGRYCCYTTVFQDGETYRAYYRGYADLDKQQVTCYAESTDGLLWSKPNLGLFEVAGTCDNNVILVPPADRDYGPTHNFAPYPDARPGVPDGERLKALAGTGQGLWAYASADGVHWREMQKEPVFTRGDFDSQNVFFWSESEGCYLCYFRRMHEGCRWICRTTSDDFLNWADPVLMDFGDVPPEHLYTNATTPYFRAPHIYIALPGRFIGGRQVLTDDEAHAFDVGEGEGWHDCSDGVFMSSRGGDKYDRRFMEAFVRPGIGLNHWVSRSNYPARGIVSTGPEEISIYVQRDMSQTTAYLQRLALRTDGFVSVNAPYAGGEMVTRPFTFAGRELEMNYATSAAGGLRVEIQDAGGKPVEGFALDNCPEIIGDQVERVVAWTSSDVGSLAGKPVRLRFVMKDADLYAIRFRP